MELDYHVAKRLGKPYHRVEAGDFEEFKKRGERIETREGGKVDMSKVGWDDMMEEARESAFRKYRMN